MDLLAWERLARRPVACGMSFLEAPFTPNRTLREVSIMGTSMSGRRCLTTYQAVAGPSSGASEEPVPPAEEEGRGVG